MAKRPGHVEVVTEVGYCNFCNRSRNLRREEHHLGGLIRTIVSCETCHRTLSSTMGVAGAEPEPAKAEAAPEPAPEAEAEEPKRAAPKSAGPTRTTPRGSTGAAAKKPAVKKAAAKPKTPPKPRSSGTRKSTRSR